MIDHWINSNKKKLEIGKKKIKKSCCGDGEDRSYTTILLDT